jgi:hypothetical protein
LGLCVALAEYIMGFGLEVNSQARVDILWVIGGIILLIFLMPIYAHVREISDPSAVNIITTVLIGWCLILFDF